jgi:predicted fused transcriptional regulator/phosphomethylpyrimidine kinase
LIANLNVLTEKRGIDKVKYDAQLVDLVIKLKHDLERLPRNATDEQAKSVMKNLVNPLLAVSKCPDFVVNRGHYFGTGFRDPGADDPVGEPALSDADKRALIEFLKTF